MLTINNRPCTIGPSINTRTEKHGDEDVPAMDIPLTGIMLNREELQSLLGEPHAHAALFNDRRDGLAEPLFPQLHPLRLKDKFEDATVTINVGLGEPIILQGVKLSKVSLQPVVGGLTELCIQVQCTPEMDGGVATLLAFLNRACEVEIVVGKRAVAAKAQPELPLNQFGEGEQDGKETKGRKGKRRDGHASLN